MEQVVQRELDSESVPVIVATENPVRTSDPETDGTIDEIILMSGGDLPESVPFIDSHSTHSVKNVLGSVRNLRVEGTQLLGDVYFAGDEESQRVKTLYQDKHLRGVSVSVLKLETERRGKEIYVTKWRLLEASAVVAGADDEAISLVRFVTHQKGQRTMTEPTNQGGSNVQTTNEPTATQQAVNQQSVTQPVIPQQTTTEETLVVERKRTANILDLCNRAQIPVADKDRYLLSTMTPEQVAVDILTRGRPSQPTTQPAVTMGESEDDKIYRAMQDAVLMRVCGNHDYDTLSERSQHGKNRDAVTYNKEVSQRLAKPAPGALDFRYARPADLARELLMRRGESYLGVPDQELIRKACRSRYSNQGILKRSSVYMTQGSLANLYLDAANKTLLAMYDEADVTYTQWVRIAMSVRDFKPIHRIRFGEFTNPEVVARLQDYPEAKVSDAKASYSPDKHGYVFSFAFEDLVNDDLDAMTRIPAMLGWGMRRQINYDCYQLLINNKLTDGSALFSTANSNGANVTIGKTGMNTLFKQMAMQKGLSNTRVLNIRPKFLITPVALEADAAEFLNSSADLTSEKNSNVVNIYGPGQRRSMTLISDGDLDTSSEAMFYLAADSRQADTCEIAFLQGEESPVIEDETTITNDSFRYRARQTYGVAAIDHKGLQRGGAAVS